MTTSLARQRCFNHAQREAAARCPQCRRFFCRECVVEHEDRLLCAACLAVMAGDSDRRTRRRAGLRALAGAIAGLLLVWAFFMALGWGLLHLPSPTHEEQQWKGSVFDE